MGVLGEDLITCDVGDVHKDHSRCRVLAVCCLTLGITLLAMLCITLLTNDAAQNMAAWTFEGDFRVGAVVGLALLVSVPVLLRVLLRRGIRSRARLLGQCPLVDA